MARRVSDAQKRAAAVQAGRRMIARGERPLYRVTVAPDASWTVTDLPDLRGVAESRRVALGAARAAVAAFLDVDPEAFDLEARALSAAG